MNFSERLEDLLKKEGKTKVEVANFAGITTQTFYDWKKKGAVPNADTAVKIAKYLDTSVEYLITGEDENSLSKKVDTLTQKIEAAKKILETP